MNNKFQKILIIRSSGIGDLIMLTPALKILRKNLPKAAIDIFIGQPVAGEVLEEDRTVNKIWKCDWQTNNLLNKLKFIWKLQKEKYDLVIVSTGINPFLGSLFAFLTGAKFRVGEYRRFKMPFYNHQIKTNKNHHKIQSNIELLQKLGLKIEKAPSPFFEFKKEDEEFAQNFIKKIRAKRKILIGFHPGAGEKQLFKVWPKDNFIELGRKILENYKKACLILFGDSKEKELCQEIKEKIGRDAFVVTSLTLKQAAALIDNCQGFVSSDSGMAHVAATTRTNLIALFGPGLPGRTGPVGEKVYIIKEKCSYPSHDLLNPKYDTKRVHKCLERITPDRVFNELKKVLNRTFAREQF
jgi:lipopolysaccharide heptosyltransferase II